MKRIVMFGGTSDGRRLAERLSAYPVEIVLSVATEYGRDVLSGLPDRVRVVTGRLDADGMRELFLATRPDYIIDATHPYAVAASMTVREAASAYGQDPIRLYRAPGADESDPEADVRFFPSIRAAAADVQHTDERVLLTVGAKGLSDFTGIDNFSERLFPRVLPSVESIEECLRHGYRRSHIIAMQGPFSEALNKALMEQFDIQALVTKDGGVAGGLGEKLSAARRHGARVLVVGRPIGDGGVTMEEIVGRIGRDVEASCG